MIDPVDLRDLWRQHGSRLLLIARSIGEPAEDAVQEAFVKLATQPEMPDDPLAWMTKVVRNQLRQWWRSGRRRREREQERDGQRWFEPPVDESADFRLDAAQAVSALQSLPIEEREIVVMHLWGELSFQAIAEIIGRSPATTHRRYQQGVRSLQRLLAPPKQTSDNPVSTFGTADHP